MIIKIWSLLIAVFAFIALILTLITNKKTEINKYATIKLILDIPVFTACVILGIRAWFDISSGLKILFIFTPYIILRIFVNLIQFSKRKRQKVCE